MVFDGIVAFASPPGETNRLFVVEKSGSIHIINNFANPTKTLFLDLTDRVDAAGEGGLLGLAFHPGYATNRLFYIFYTLQTSTAAGSGLHDRLSRFQTSPSNPGQALVGSEVPLITQFDEADNHNAGDLHFGPDGYLYVSLGDEGGGGYDFNRNSRTITKDFFSGILRIDVDKRPGNLVPNSHPASSSEYLVPADNPFVGATSFSGVAINPSNVRTEFWAVGMRNPWRFSFDPVTGRLFSGDVGESLREEINLIAKGGIRQIGPRGTDDTTGVRHLARHEAAVETRKDLAACKVARGPEDHEVEDIHRNDTRNHDRLLGRRVSANGGLIPCARLHV